MAELTFNSAELRNVEVVACVCGYSQSPISSFPISLLNAFKTIQQLYNDKTKKKDYPEIWTQQCILTKLRSMVTHW